MKKATIITTLFLTSSLFSQTSTDALFEMSLEELLDITVSGITRQKEDSFKSTSAVFVVSSEEIRRSGATNIPEILEMVPGFHVGQLSGNMFAVNARGGHSRFARQLLVMIDGRNVYSPTVNNVYWDQLDLIMEDIERVEVIRGPGSSLWGSNAANGIVNIVTKNSSSTEGILTYAQTATEHLNYDIAARYGYKTENQSGRIYAKQKELKRSIYPSLEEQSKSGNTTPYDESYDGKLHSHIGYRHDAQLNDDITFMLNTQYQQIKTEEVKTFFGAEETLYKTDGAYILSSLDMTHSQTSNSKLQLYVDYLSRDNEEIDDTKTLYDVDFQNNFKIADLKTIWGLGYRYLNHSYHNSGNFYANSMNPSDEQLTYYSAFLQFSYMFLDESVELIAGSKYENNFYTGDEFMPTIRLGIYPNDTNTLWVSATKTASTPSRQSSDGYLDISAVTDPDGCAQVGGTIDPELGCSAAISEKTNSSYMHVYELGYRIKLFSDLLLDQNVFYNQYEKHNNETDKLEFVMGYELSAKYLVNTDVTLNAFYTYHEAKNAEASISHEANAIPRNTLGLRSSVNVSKEAEFDMFYRHQSPTRGVNELNQLNFRFGYSFDSGVETSLLLSNILDRYHVEPNYATTRANSYIQTSALLKLTYRY